MHRGPVLLPNLEDPERLLKSPRQAPDPAVFAPVPFAWKERWAAAGDAPLGLGDALDWMHFQAAPRAQQLAFLRGDEPFVIRGLSAEHPTIEGALPGLCARCFGATNGTRLEEVALRLDTIVINVDAMRLDLVWRGALPVVDERAPGIESLHVLAEKVGAPTPLDDVFRKVRRT
jgi:hypothetical protein